MNKIFFAVKSDKRLMTTTISKSKIRSTVSIQYSCLDLLSLSYIPV